MAANQKPIFPSAPKAQITTKLTTANTAKDGTGTVVTLGTAGANGAFVGTIEALPLGTNVASVLRVFLNNGSTNATATNNSLKEEISLPATTINEAAGQTKIVITCNYAIPAGYVLNATIGTTVAAGWQVTALMGDY